MTSISFFKQPPKDINLNPTAQYLKQIQTVAQSADLGGTIGTQMFVVKTKALSGDCNIIITPNNGQHLTLGTTYSQTALLNWIDSDGFIVSNMSIVTISGSPYIKTIDNSLTDQYVWFGLSESGNVGRPTISQTNTYTIEFSGNYASPESLLKSSGVAGPLTSGIYDNPVLINPNSLEEYNSSYGDCTSGGYYFSFQAIANIPRHLIVIPEENQTYGVIISSVKSQLRTWLGNNGSGTLTDGGNFTQTTSGQNLNIDIELTATKTMYAAYYSLNSIGNNSCTSGKKFSLQSQQEVESGSNNGTYANPYLISNNLLLDNADMHNHGDGECTKGGVYYAINVCSDADLTLTISQFYSDRNIGIAACYDKSVLATFLRTGNYTVLSGLGSYITGLGEQTLVVGSGAIQMFVVVFNPDSIGTNLCSDTSRFFKLGTKQLNCNGGGYGRDGRYNTPYEVLYDQSRVHAAGDCDINGRIWYYGTLFCNQAPINISITSENGQTVGLAWSSIQADLQTYLDNGGSGGGGGGSCGSWDASVGTSSYIDTTSTYFNYYNSGSVNHWVGQTSGLIYLQDYLPGGGMWIGPEGVGDYMLFGEVYAASGPIAEDLWLNPYTLTMVSFSQLPDCSECGTCGGGGSGFYPDNINSDLTVPSHITTDSSKSVVIPNTYGNGVYIYFAVFLPDSDPNTQCSNYNTYSLNVFSEYCDIWDNGGYHPLGTNSDPYPISNNFTKSLPIAAGYCDAGAFFMKGYICGTNTLTFNVNSMTYLGTYKLAWANDLMALYDWVNTGGLNDLSAYDGGFTESIDGTTIESLINVSTTGLYYFVVYNGSYNCTNTGLFTITTSQTTCDGSSVGTYDSPIGIGNSETLLINENDGECFSSVTYLTTQLCADTSASFTIIPASYSNLQCIIWDTNKTRVKDSVDLYKDYGSIYTPDYGGYNIDPSTSSPTVIHVPAASFIRTLYIALFDKKESYNSIMVPRCDRTGTISLNIQQSCPLVDVGGSQGISGAKNYSIDPFSSRQKSGVSINNGDTNNNIDVSLLYSPTLEIHNSSDYPTNIQCFSIVSTLYVNKKNGFTNIISTKTTSACSVIKNTTSDITYIKPIVGSELLFSNINMYTGVIQTIFTTNIGRYVRNQVVNAGSTFTSGNQQYSYVIASSGTEMTIVIPVVEEYAHTIVTSGGIISPDITWLSYNTAKINLTSPQQVNTVLDIPFKSANSSTYYNAKALIK